MKRISRYWIGGLLAALMMVTICTARANDSFVEDWSSQNVGDTVKEFQAWRKSGQGPVTNLQIVEVAGKKTLEIRQSNEEPRVVFGVRMWENLTWRNELEIAFEVAATKNETASPKAAPSFIVTLSKGGLCYFINVREKSLQISKLDPAHPNPDKNYAVRDFTPLGRLDTVTGAFNTEELQRFRLTLKREGGEVRLALYRGNQNAPLLSAVDSTPVELGNSVTLGLQVENNATVRIGRIQVDNK